MAIQLIWDVGNIIIDAIDPLGFNNYVPNEDINKIAEQLLVAQYTAFEENGTSPFQPFTPDFIEGEHQKLWVDTATQVMNEIHINGLMRLPDDTLETYLDKTITDTLDRMEASGKTDIEDYERIEEFMTDDAPYNAALLDAINKNVDKLFSAECIASILCKRFNSVQSDYTYEVIPCVSEKDKVNYAFALTQERAEKWNLANKKKWKDAFDLYIDDADKEKEPPPPMALYTDTLYKPDPTNSEKGVKTTVQKGCYVGANMGMVYSYCEKPRQAPSAGTVDPTKYGTC